MYLWNHCCWQSGLDIVFAPAVFKRLLSSSLHAQADVPCSQLIYNLRSFFFFLFLQWRKCDASTTVLSSAWIYLVTPSRPPFVNGYISLHDDRAFESQRIKKRAGQPWQHKTGRNIRNQATGRPNILHNLDFPTCLACNTKYLVSHIFVLGSKMLKGTWLTCQSCGSWFCLIPEAFDKFLPCFLLLS